MQHPQPNDRTRNAGCVRCSDVNRGVCASDLLKIGFVHQRHSAAKWLVWSPSMMACGTFILVRCALACCMSGRGRSCRLSGVLPMCPDTVTHECSA